MGLIHLQMFYADSEAIRYIYTLDGVKLESVDSQKDLGVTISKTLKPATHIDIITKKAYQKIGMI